jgi:hypothetical protein
VSESVGAERRHRQMLREMRRMHWERLNGKNPELYKRENPEVYKRENPEVYRKLSLSPIEKFLGGPFIAPKLPPTVKPPPSPPSKPAAPSPALQPTTPRARREFFYSLCERAAPKIKRRS